MGTTVLGESGFWILSSLGQGRRHGYAIIREVEALSERDVTLKVATLYSTLERLQKAGWIAPDGEEVVDGRARRYYCLTESGEQRLQAELGRLEAKVRAVRSRPNPGWTVASAPA